MKCFINGLFKTTMIKVQAVVIWIEETIQKILTVIIVVGLQVNQFHINKFPKLNEEREKENYDFKVNTSYNYCYEDEEEKLEDSEPYYEDEEEDCEDIDINSEEFKRDLEMFRNLQKNKKI